MMEDEAYSESEFTEDEVPSKLYPHKKYKWTDEESDRLIKLVKKSQGTRGKPINWPRIAKQLRAGRTGKQCRERYMNSRPDAKRGDWETEEEDELARLHALLAPAWTRIMNEGQLAHRTDNAIKNHFNALVRCKTLNTRPLSLLTTYVAFIRGGAPASPHTLELAQALFHQRRALSSNTQQPNSLSEAVEVSLQEAVALVLAAAGVVVKPAGEGLDAAGGAVKAAGEKLAAAGGALEVTGGLLEEVTPAVDQQTSVDEAMLMRLMIAASVPDGTTGVPTAAIAIAAKPVAVRIKPRPARSCQGPAVKQRPAASRSANASQVPADDEPVIPMSCAWRTQLLNALLPLPAATKPPSQNLAAMAGNGGLQLPSSAASHTPFANDRSAQRSMQAELGRTASGRLGNAARAAEAVAEPETLVSPCWQVTTAVQCTLSSSSSEPSSETPGRALSPTPSRGSGLRRQSTFGLGSSTHMLGKMALSPSKSIPTGGCTLSHDSRRRGRNTMSPTPEQQRGSKRPSVSRMPTGLTNAHSINSAMPQSRMLLAHATAEAMSLPPDFPYKHDAYMAMDLGIRPTATPAVPTPHHEVHSAPAMTSLAVHGTGQHLGTRAGSESMHKKPTAGLPDVWESAFGEQAGDRRIMETGADHMDPELYPWDFDMGSVEGQIEEDWLILPPITALCEAERSDMGPMGWQQPCEVARNGLDMDASMVAGWRGDPSSGLSAPPAGWRGDPSSGLSAPPAGWRGDPSSGLSVRAPSDYPEPASARSACTMTYTTTTTPAYAHTAGVLPYSGHGSGPQSMRQHEVEADRTARNPFHQRAVPAAEVMHASAWRLGNAEADWLSCRSSQSGMGSLSGALVGQHVSGVPSIPVPPPAYLLNPARAEVRRCLRSDDGTEDLWQMLMK